MAGARVRACSARCSTRSSPRRCAGCGAGTWPFCGRCRPSSRSCSPPWCERCGAPVAPRAVGDLPALPARADRRARARRSCSRGPSAGPSTGSSSPGGGRSPRRSATAMVAAWATGWSRAGRDHLGAAVARPARRLAGSTRRRRWRARSRRGSDLPADRAAPPRRRSPVRRPGEAGTPGGGRCAGCFAAASTAPARVLLVDDVLTTGRHRRGVREARSWRLRARARSPCSTAARGRRRRGATAGPILALGPASGSVVARGIAPR